MRSHRTLKITKLGRSGWRARERAPHVGGALSTNLEVIRLAEAGEAAGSSRGAAGAVGQTRHHYPGTLP